MIDGYSLDSTIEARAQFISNGSLVNAVVSIQDDGGEPYAVVDLKKPKKVPGDWASYVSLNIESIYPPDFEKIPAYVKWLHETDIALPDTRSK